MQYLGIFAAICSTSASMPQLFSPTPQTLRPWSIALRCTGAIAWTIYGAEKKDYALTAASTATAGIEIILYIKRYRALSRSLSSGIVPALSRVSIVDSATKHVGS